MHYIRRPFYGPYTYVRFILGNRGPTYIYNILYSVRPILEADDLGPMQHCFKPSKGHCTLMGQFIETSSENQISLRLQFPLVCRNWREPFYPIVGRLLVRVSLNFNSFFVIIVESGFRKLNKTHFLPS